RRKDSFTAIAADCRPAWAEVARIGTRGLGTADYRAASAREVTRCTESGMTTLATLRNTFFPRAAGEDGGSQMGAPGKRKRRVCRQPAKPLRRVVVTGPSAPFSLRQLPPLHGGSESCV